MHIDEQFGYRTHSNSLTEFADLRVDIVYMLVL